MPTPAPLANIKALAATCALALLLSGCGSGVGIGGANAPSTGNPNPPDPNPDNGSSVTATTGATSYLGGGNLIFQHASSEYHRGTYQPHIATLGVSGNSSRIAGAAGIAGGSATGTATFGSGTPLAVAGTAAGNANAVPNYLRQQQSVTINLRGIFTAPSSGVGVPRTSIIYQAPAPMRLARNSGVALGANHPDDATAYPLNYNHRLLAAPLGNTLAYTHYLRAENAALAMYYYTTFTSNISADGQRIETSTLSAWRMWQGGAPATPSTFFSEHPNAKYNGRYSLDGRYIIPVGAAFGHAIAPAPVFVGNAVSLVQVTALLYNKQPGELRINFIDRATLNVSLSDSQGARARQFWFDLRNWELKLHPNNSVLSNTHCRSGGGSGGQGGTQICQGTLHARVPGMEFVQNNSNAGGRAISYQMGPTTTVVVSTVTTTLGTHDRTGDPVVTTSTSTVTSTIVAITGSVTRNPSGTFVSVYGNFYGNNAQEFALAILHGGQFLAGPSGNHSVQIGILGRRIADAPMSTPWASRTATRIGGSSGNLFMDAYGVPYHLNGRSLGSAITASHLALPLGGEGENFYVNSTAQFTFDHTGISARVTSTNTNYTAIYTRPAALYLSGGGGSVVAAANANLTVPYMHRMYRSGTAGSADAIYTHYLGAEYSAFALQYSAESVPTVHHIGSPTPASYFTSRGANNAIYTIPKGGAFGHHHYIVPVVHTITQAFVTLSATIRISNSLTLAPAATLSAGQVITGVALTQSYFISNQEEGTLAADLLSGYATLNISLNSNSSVTTTRTVAVSTRLQGNRSTGRYEGGTDQVVTVTLPGSGGYYKLSNWQLRINSGALDNQHCNSYNGTPGRGAQNNCGGYADASRLPAFPARVYNTNDYAGVNVTPRSTATVRVGGSFYGNNAQEFALGVQHSNGRYSVVIGILGRKAQEGGASGLSRDAGASGAGAGGASGAGASSSPADYLAFLQAEGIAFSAGGAGGNIAIYGAQAPASTADNRSGTAVYAIASGNAGGKYTAADGSEHHLRASGSGNNLAVDFSNDTARLNLRVAEEGTSNAYEVSNLALQLTGSTFSGSGGNVSGEGALQGMTGGTPAASGAFYGTNAQNAAGILTQTSSGTLNLGFIATE